MCRRDPTAAVTGHTLADLRSAEHTRTPRRRARSLETGCAAGADPSGLARYQSPMRLYQQSPNVPDTDAQKKSRCSLRRRQSASRKRLQIHSPLRAHARVRRVPAATSSVVQQSLARCAGDWNSPNEFGKPTNVSEEVLEKSAKILIGPANVLLWPAIAAIRACFISFGGHAFRASHNCPECCFFSTSVLAHWLPPRAKSIDALIP
jgi:hypothetical protein